MEDHNELVLGGGSRKVKKAVPVPGRITLKGNAFAVDRAPKAEIVCGYALTPGVDAEFFEEWLRQNADHDAVRNGMIFAHMKAEDVSAEAREKKDVKSGLEPINRNKLPKGIETAKTEE